MININSYKNDIINAYVEVYGEEYRSIIEDRIHNQNIIIEVSNSDLIRLLEDRINNKILDLNIDFYKTFSNLDLEEYRPRIYSCPLTLDSVKDLPVFRFDGRERDLEKYKNNPNYYKIRQLINNREYKRCQRELLEYVKETLAFKEELSPKVERKEKATIADHYNVLLNKEILDLLPRKIKDALKDDFEFTLDNVSLFDCFSSESINSGNQGVFYNLVYNQRIEQYLSIFDSKKIDKSKLTDYYPSTELVKKIKAIKYKYKLAYEKEAVFKNSLVIENPIIQQLLSNNSDRICTPIIEGRVCQLNFMVDGQFQSIIVMPLSEHYRQHYNQTLVHELGHSITTSNDGFVGVENCNIMDNIETNDVNQYKRNYEVMNETLTDIFAYRANMIMQEKNQFLFEDQFSSYVYDNERDYNSCAHYLLPLLDLMEDDVKKAMINSDQSYIRNIITDEKFEELNDLINKRYALSHNRTISDAEFDRIEIMLDDERDRLYEEIKQIINKKKNRDLK